MKKSVYLLGLFAVAMACKKPVSDLDTTPVLEVEEKNMGVLGVRTATWCGPCGSSLNNTQDLFEQNKHLVVGMAFKDAFNGVGGPHSDWGNYLFDQVGPQFDLGNSVPTNFQNFKHNTVAEHLQAPTVVSGNYEIEFEGNDMTISTTTKFFMDFEGELYLAPFVIVNNLVGQQADHPESPNTVHTRYVADVAYPANKTADSKFEWGYLVSAGEVRNGHTFNTTFKATKKSHWVNNNIMIGMVYFRKVGNEFIFVNAFTK